MQNSHTGRRLGFILSTIHAGSALKLWHKVVQRAQTENGAFFVFPGGKLDSKSSREHLRNDIYKLVNSSNLDGLVSWASSISGSVSVQELEEFHKNFHSIPFVTIGQKIPGHPCVEFDAYSGMKELVRHFIQVHGVKKIAFLRGPETHTSAQDRFRGYKDALIEAGLDNKDNQALVSSPLNWYDGELGAKWLYEEKGLVPGKDFEALLSASDLMTFAAVNYFKQRGIRIPKDLLVGGFNDTEESRISIPSFSTVHMPHADLGIEGYEKISNILSGMSSVKAVAAFIQKSGHLQIFIQKFARKNSSTKKFAEFSASIPSLLALNQCLLPCLRMTSLNFTIYSLRRFLHILRMAAIFLIFFLPLHFSVL